jgi:macrolide transport system ATP-binding/permease protein
MNMNAPLTASQKVKATSELPLIALRDITKTYGRGDVATKVLHGISLDIEAGEFIAIMGASGSGKSTLMNLIGLLDRPTSGSYRLNGEEVSELDSDARADLRREAFGFIFQQYNLLAGATAAENVEVPAIYAGMSHAKRIARANEILTSLGLGDRLEYKPGQLSGGQQQRVCIARALMNGGAIILADEPTGALDSHNGEEVMRLLKDLNSQGHTILLITHDRDVAQTANRIVEFRDGYIVSDTRTDHAANEMSAPAKGVSRGKPGRGITLPNIAEAAKMALRSLRGNLMRTLLTLLGIIIGVASVVAMLAIGDGAKQSVLDRLSGLGPDLLVVRPGAPNLRTSGGFTATLVAADADAIASLPNVAASVPEYPGQVTVRYGNRDYVTQANATGAGFPRARSWSLAQGSFFDAADVRSYAPVVVLGETVVKAIMPDEAAPLGKYILVNNIPFQVIGILAPKGAGLGGNDQDDIVFTPVTTGALRLFGQRYVRYITVQAADVTRIDETQEAVRQLLLDRHRTEDFQIRNMAAILQMATATQNTLTLMLGSIALISLLVGGIGVMNIMLVSVTERTREIGIRLATGARTTNILLQFNTEALVVCALGGVIGVLFGLGTAWLFDKLGQPALFSPGPVVLAFFCAFATGLIFGFLPARKAARLDPVAALAAD